MADIDTKALFDTPISLGMLVVLSKNILRKLEKILENYPKKRSSQKI